MLYFLLINQILNSTIIYECTVLYLGRSNFNTIVNF